MRWCKIKAVILWSLRLILPPQAAAGVNIPADFRVSIVNSSNPKAYPIAGFSWMLIYKNMTIMPVKGKAIVDFAKWAVTDGQKLFRGSGLCPVTL